MTHVVFVYGTLRKGQPNRHVMVPHLVRELGEGRIRGAMYSLGAYPAVDLEQDGEVIGEWVEVTDEGLARLDSLEGYPGYYDRTVVRDISQPVSGWVYHMSGKIPPHGVIKLPGGDWVAYRRMRQAAPRC
jgi:gamma-glutamylcyclotransferase (GGCT)/AIG2-like uncharacterized protein YtfP